MSDGPTRPRTTIGFEASLAAGGVSRWQEDKRR